MTDIILTILVALHVCVIAFFLGVRFGWSAKERQLAAFAHSMFSEAQAEFAKNHVHLKVTKEGNMFLLHDANDGTFLAQGNSYRELADTLKQRFPNKFFTASPEDLKLIGNVNDAV